MTWVRANGAQADGVGHHRDLEARALHLHLGVAGRDDEPTAQRNLGDVRFQRPALDVEPLGRVERGQSDPRRRTDAQSRARIEREQQMSGARHTHGRSGRDASAGVAGRAPSGVSIAAPRPSTSATASFVSARASLSRDGARRRAARWTAGCASRPTAAPLPPPRPRPTRSTARDGAVRGRGARAQSPRRSRFDPAASSPFPLRRRPRPAAEHLGREARVARGLLGSPHPCPSVRSNSVANSGSAATRACRSLRPRTRRLWAAAGLIDRIWATSRRS